MESNRFWRQLDLCPPDKLTFPIAVIGAGAIGSAAVVTLAKMGCSNITGYDADDLADHNVPNQMCLPEYVGFPKVDALAHLVEMLTSTQIKPVSSNYRGQRLQGVVIATQVRAERTARAEAERELARERAKRERERRDAQAGLKLAERKSTFSSVVAIVVASVATAAIVLVARERRIRSTLAAGLRHLLGRRDDHGP